MTVVRKIEFQGTPRAMGEAHGEALRDEIIELANERIEIICTESSVSVEDVEATAREVQRAIAEQVPAVYEETLHTSRAAGIEYWKLVVAGGYTDVKDRAAHGDGSKEARSECTLIPWRGEDGSIWLAGTWDSHATAELSLVLVERHPAEGPATLALSTAGWPMQQGITARRLGFAITNLVAKSTRPGISYIAALPEAALSSTLDGAVECLTRLVSCSARFYALCDGNGHYVGLETDGDSYWCSSDPDVHTNHFIYSGARDAEGQDATASEVRRSKAVRELQRSQPRDARSLFRVLEMHDGTDTCVSHRAGGRETRSCAGFVLDPATLSMLVTAGPPGLSSPQEYKLAL